MNQKFFQSICLVWTIVITGSLAFAQESHLQKEEPSIAVSKNQNAFTPDTFDDSELTLEKAITRVLGHNLDLKIAAFGETLAEAEKQAAAILPNPELEFEYENFDEPEKTISIGYLIELGGKRRLRMGLADAEMESAIAEYDATRNAIIYQTAQAFIDVAVAREHLALAKDREKTTRQVAEAAKERMRAGQIAAREQMAAEINQRNAELDVQNAKAEMTSARLHLAALWGGAAADVSDVAADFDRIDPVPPLYHLINAIAGAPAIRQIQKKINAAKVMLDLEKRHRIPDLEISGGMIQSDETDDTVYVAGFSLPLPLFDRNQAGIARAAAEHGQLNATLEAAKKSTIKETQISHQHLLAAHHHVLAIQTDILPSAREVFDSVQQGYQAGEFGFLDLVDAQRTLYDALENHIQSLSQYHHAKIEIERLLGKRLADITAADPLVCDEPIIRSRTR